jgi:hypothetical protein
MSNIPTFYRKQAGPNTLLNFLHNSGTKRIQNTLVERKRKSMAKVEARKRENFAKGGTTRELIKV